MAPLKSSISTHLAPFQRQAYQSWYLDGFTLVQFTKLMDILFEELAKITFGRLSASERQWRTCKTVWDNAWNIKGGGIHQEARLGLEDLHVWFCKSPCGAVIWKPLGLDSLTLATLLPGLTMASETLHSAGQPLSLNQTWDDTGDDEGYVREEKLQPLDFNPASSETNQHYSAAKPADIHVPNTNGTSLMSHSQTEETHASLDGVFGNYTPYSQSNDRSCVLTAQAISETASSTNDVGSYCTMSQPQGTIYTPDGPANTYTEWPESVAQGRQCISTCNNSGFDLCSKDASQIDWLADIDS
ncbi:hypothetical protein JMJ35_008696 [Cladonia borealis]|uniref:Uncharacterized protein n=1 Tax=Cladonia borealis TaxID=184061 RepID=A0AA39V718_9LECA|nr:hypothetical protein JMJ35_008696 [Cladonia borealis]